MGTKFMMHPMVGEAGTHINAHLRSSSLHKLRKIHQQDNTAPAVGTEHMSHIALGELILFQLILPTDPFDIFIRIVGIDVQVAVLGANRAVAVDDVKWFRGG